MSHPNFLKQYADTLLLQAQFCSRETRTVLHSLDAFRNARYMIEVGCGPGAQAIILSDLLQGKNYFGIDIVPEFISAACSWHGENFSLTFAIEDVMTYSPERE